MNKLLLIPLMILGLMLKFCTNQKDVAVETDETDEPEVVQSGEAVSPLLHGFNAENLYFHYKGEASADGLIAALQPKVLRFPGGTPANVYHFNGAGYGYDQRDLDKMVKGTGPYKNAQKSIKRESNQKNKSANKNHAEDFVRLLRQVDAQVLLVANLLGGDEDVLDMVRYFQTAGVTIAGIELGNEYYLKAYESTFPDVASYISRARPLAEKIRNEFPQIPLGVVGASSSELKDISIKQKLYYDAWNSRLAEETFFDAVISHIYAKDKSCDDLQGMARSTCYLQSNSAFVADIASGLDALAEDFSGREIWITEWNMKHVFDGLGNTTLQALYYADFSLAMSRSSAVGIATYHNLLTSSTGYNIIARDKNKSSASAPSHVPRAAHPVAAMLSVLYDGSHAHIPWELKNVDQQKLSTYALSDGKRTRYVLINKSDAELTSSGIGMSLSGAIRSQSVSGSSLMSSTMTSSAKNFKEGESGELKLAPYSITIIEEDIK